MKMQKKKAQIGGQIFIYILGLIIFSSLLIYGYKAVKDFRDRGDEVLLLKLYKDMDSSIQKTASDYGTVLKKELVIPSGYDEVCFVEKGKYSSTADFCNDKHPIICDYWKDNAPENMFLMEGGLSKNEFAIGDIVIENDESAFCMDVTNGEVLLKIEGKGNYAVISPWN